MRRAKTEMPVGGDSDGGSDWTRARRSCRKRRRNRRMEWKATAASGPTRLTGTATAGPVNVFHRCPMRSTSWSNSLPWSVCLWRSLSLHAGPCRVILGSSPRATPAATLSLEHGPRAARGALSGADDVYRAVRMRISSRRPMSVRSSEYWDPVDHVQGEAGSCASRSR